MQQLRRSHHIFIRQLDAVEGQASSFPSSSVLSFSSRAIPQAQKVSNNACRLQLLTMIIGFTASAALHIETVTASPSGSIKSCSLAEHVSQTFWLLA